MKKQIWIPILVVVVIVAGFLIFSSQKPDQPQEAQEKEVIKIGAILPLTGKGASQGAEMQNGIRLAEEKINSAEKIVEIIYEDEKCDPKEAVSAYQALRLKEVKFIIGAACSPSTLAIAPLAEKDKVVLITPGSSADDISQAGDFIFRNQVLVSQKEKKLADITVKKFNSLATIYDQTNDARILGEKVVVDIFRTSGKNVLAREGFGKNAVDFKTEIQKIKQKNPEVIFISAQTSQVTTILKQMKELKISSQVILEEGVATDPVFLEVAGNLADGIIFSGTDFSRKINPEFWDLYNNKFGKNPNIYAGQSYDCLMILANIIKEKCKTGDSVCVKDELYKVKNYPGVSGLTTFDENGDVIKPIVIKVIKNGQFVPYEE
ncbi:MAG: ABC transporter substrate-binding protein [Patescibacteria group bacterium]